MRQCLHLSLFYTCCGHFIQTDDSVTSNDNSMIRHDNRWRYLPSDLCCNSFLASHETL